MSAPLNFILTEMNAVAAYQPGDISGFMSHSPSGGKKRALLKVRGIKGEMTVEGDAKHHIARWERALEMAQQQSGAQANL